MRLTCGSHVVVCVWWHLQLLFAARGPLKTSSEPRRGRGIVFRNSRISLSAGRRACEPAAKPAIPGVILLHNGFVWPERTLQNCHSPNPTNATKGHSINIQECSLRTACQFAHLAYLKDQTGITQGNNKRVTDDTPIFFLASRS